MRLLIATDVMVRGGVDRYVERLAAGLISAGHALELVIDRGTHSDLADSGIPLPHRICLHHRSHAASEIIRDCAELLDDRVPEGVHVVCGAPWSCLALRDAVVARGVPHVVTEQFVPQTLALSRAQRASIAGSYEAARRVVFVSDGNRATMAAQVGLRGSAHEVIPNGTEAHEIARRAPQIEARRERLEQRLATAGVLGMAASRLSPEKGLDVLVDAVAQLEGGLFARTDVFGEGRDRERLESHARAVGAEGVLRFHPWAQEVTVEMSARDIFILSSRDEGMPFVLLDCMAAGMPVVASDVPGNVQALDGGRAGTIVRTGDAQSLAQGLRAAVADIPATMTRARYAQQRAIECYETVELMARTVALWRGQ